MPGEVGAARTHAVASAGTVRLVVAGQPRMYGVGLRYRFGD